MRHSRHSRPSKQPRKRIPFPKNKQSPKCIEFPEFELPLDLFIQVSDLLYKRDDSAEFQRLFEALGKPVRQYDVRTHRFYDFDQCGLGMTYDIAKQTFSATTFHFDTAGVRSGEISPYSGDLPAGIEWTDSCLVAEAKLGAKPKQAGWVEGCDSAACDTKSRASSFWQHFDVSPSSYTLIFTSEEGGLNMVGMKRIESA